MVDALARDGVARLPEPAPSFDTGLMGKRAVVVGGGGGIGLATATLLSQLGAAVGVVDIDAERRDHTMNLLSGRHHAWFGADVRRGDQVTGLVDQVTRHLGEPDVLVNAVGIGGPASDAVSLDDATWDELVDVNLRQQFLVARAFLPGMIARGRGSVVAVSSVNAITSSPLRIAYGVAKAGLDSLVRTLAIEGGPHGVRTNSVRPGATLTPRRSHLGEGELGELYQREVPLGRLAEPTDVANAIVFLASDLARHVNGESIVVDGGAAARYCQPAGN